MGAYEIARFAEKALRPDPPPRRPRRRPIELHQHHLHSQHPAVAFYGQVGSNIAQDANRVSTSNERGGGCLRGGVGSPVESPPRSGGRHDQDSDSAANDDIRRAGGRRASKRPVIHDPSTGGYSFYGAPSPAAQESYGEASSSAPERDQLTGALPRRARSSAPSPPDSYLGPTAFPYPYVSPDYSLRRFCQSQQDLASSNRAHDALPSQSLDEGEIIKNRLCLVGRNLAQELLEIVDLFERKKEREHRAARGGPLHGSPLIQEHHQEDESRLQAGKAATVEQERRDAIDGQMGDQRLALERKQQIDDRVEEMRHRLYSQEVDRAAEADTQRQRAASEDLRRENRERSQYSRTHRAQGVGGSERGLPRGRENGPGRDAYDLHRSSA